MKIKKAHCLFEQSGTFKKEFIKLGIPAEDYDILNDFNETNNIIDIFNEIENAYNRKSSVFDNISEDDIIMAFFPCVRFSNQIYMWFQGTNWAQRNWDDIQKLEKNLELHDELHIMYSLITKLAIVCLYKGLRLIIENPYSQEHYLTRYWSLRAEIIDKDRKLRGDYYSKPTQYWFINCKPERNYININYEDKGHAQIIDTHNKAERSMLSPEYARHFILEHILDGEKLKQQTIFDILEEDNENE